MKNSSDTIENRTRYLLACSAVPQPTAPPFGSIVKIKQGPLNTVEVIGIVNIYITRGKILVAIYCLKLYGHGL
jgi:hypothetical protein